MSHISRRNLMTAGSGLTLAAAIGLVRPAWAAEMGTVVEADAYSYMLQDPRLSTWVQLINAGGMVDAARTAIYTVAPAADSAFAQFPGMVNRLLGYTSATGAGGRSPFPDTSLIVKLVRSHVVAGKHFPGEVMGKQVTFTSVAGTPIQVDGTDPKAVKLIWPSAANGQALTATLTAPPIITTNAVIYIIDAVGKM